MPRKLFDLGGQHRLFLPRRRILAVMAGGIVLAVASRWWLAEKADQTYESAYNTIIVKTDGRVITFRRIETGNIVSAIDLDHPARQVIPYTGYLLAPALVNAHPAKVLNIGLGAGAFNRLFSIGFPEARMTTVEIDPMIVDVARRLTDFKEGANDKVVIADGRRYLHRTDENFDWIIIDAYVRNSQVPPHLTTVEFFTLAGSRLAERGVLAMNLHNSAPVFASIVATLTKVFPDVALLTVPNPSDPTHLNVIVLAAKTKGELAELLRAAPADGLPDLKVYGVDWASFREPADPATVTAGAMVLTDDFAPTEFLSGGRVGER